MNYLAVRQIKTTLKSKFIKTFSNFHHKKQYESNIYAVVTIDTEQDVNAKYINKGTYANIKYGLPKIIKIFKKYNCKGTFLVTPDAILENTNFFNEIKDGHEIGCHVHPEFFINNNINNIRHKEYLCNLPCEVQKEMITKSTKIIEKIIGKKPTSFRAGRFGISGETIDILIKEGYLVDTSCTPFINWNNDGGPNWSTCSKNTPFFINNLLLEVPITILNFYGIKYWLRPSVSDIIIMKEMIDLLNNSEFSVVNLMFHSMESIDPNPYLNSQIFLYRLENIISYLSSKNCEFVTLNELYNNMKKKKGI